MFARCSHNLHSVICLLIVSKMWCLLMYVRFSYMFHSVTCLLIISEMCCLLMYIRFWHILHSVTCLLIISKMWFLLMHIRFSHNVHSVTCLLIISEICGRLKIWLRPPFRQPKISENQWKTWFDHKHVFIQTDILPPNAEMRLYAMIFAHLKIEHVVLAYVHKVFAKCPSRNFIT
jgi:hypothetical protein